MMREECSLLTEIIRFLHIKPTPKLYTSLPIPSPYTIPAFPIALANISRHLTLAPNRAHSKNAPLNFRCKLYVSSGGGLNRSLTITGMNPLTLSVIVWLLKSYTSGDVSMNGSANVSIDEMCAFSMAWDSWPVR